MNSRPELRNLERLNTYKASQPAPFDGLGDEIVHFFKKSVEPRHTKLGKIGEAWDRLVPPPLAEHACLDSLSRGTLTVLVDTASHLYDLRQLLLAGLEKQMLGACRTAGLRKIALKRGIWYDQRNGDKRVDFS